MPLMNGGIFMLEQSPICSDHEDLECRGHKKIKCKNSTLNWYFFLYDRTENRSALKQIIKKTQSPVSSLLPRNQLILSLRWAALISLCSY